MTVRLIWEAALVETTKEGAPAILLEDFNYYINKAIRLYMNKRYNVYDINLLTTDDLRVLKSTAFLTPKHSEISNDDICYVNLPLDYFHMLNCVCVYKMKQRYKCYDKDTTVKFPAKRLTADAWSEIMRNYYFRPLPLRPYYYINHVNTSLELPTNPTNSNELNSNFTGTDSTTDYSKDSSNLPRIIKLSDTFENNSLVEKEAGVRYGNPSNIRCEIRYGDDNATFELTGVYIDYIKTPQFIRLTQTQVNLTLDTSLIMEFPDYVCQEIINELVTIIMASTTDPRLQAHVALSLTIPSALLLLPNT